MRARPVSHTIMAAVGRVVNRRLPILLAMRRGGWVLGIHDGRKWRRGWGYRELGQLRSDGLG
jgi:hypothetical protein